MHGFTPTVVRAIAEFRATHPHHRDAGPFWQPRWRMHGRDGQRIAYEEYYNRFVGFGADRDELMVLDWAALEINGVRTEGPLKEMRAKGRAFLEEHKEVFPGRA